MKYGFFFSIIFLLNISVAQSQTTVIVEEMTSKFKVYGNCGMCEKRIEKAAKIEGVSSADWNVETKILTITFNPAVVRPSQVHTAVAAVGHDTEKVRADDEVYANLHGCCQYERRE